MGALAEAEDSRRYEQAIFYTQDAVHDFVMVGRLQVSPEGRHDMMSMQTDCVSGRSSSGAPLPRR